MIKEVLFPAIHELKECLRIMYLMLSNITIKQDILKDEKYKFLFSVEEVNKLVLSGVPFRDAYKKVGNTIEQGMFEPTTTIHHTHEGSIGNLCNDKLQVLMKKEMAAFHFEHVKTAIDKLLQ